MYCLHLTKLRVPHILHNLQILVLTKSEKSHTGNPYTGLSSDFGSTGLESGTSSVEVVKVVSSVEVMVEVVMVASDDHASVAEDKVKDI